jgi:hypothetical protein
MNILKGVSSLLDLIRVLVESAKGFIDRAIDRSFARKTLKDQLLQDRYTKLYVPLMQQILGIELVSTLPTSIRFRTTCSEILECLLTGNFRYIPKYWNLYRNQRKRGTKEEHYELESAPFSNFNFESMQKHIKKHFDLADQKLKDLLDAAVRADNSWKYREASFPESNHTGPAVTEQTYALINHIYAYGKRLHNRTHPK